MHIIIPLEDTDEGFRRDGYSVPKPLVNVLGRPLLFRVLDSLRPLLEDRVLIAYNAVLDRFGFRFRVAGAYPAIELVPVYGPSYGAADLVLHALRVLEPSRDRTVVLDGDTLSTVDVLGAYRNVAANALFYFKNGEGEQLRSYIEFSSDQHVTDIHEDAKTASFANTGAYCFRDGSILTRYCEWERAHYSPRSGQIHLSIVIKRMLSDGHRFIALEGKGVHCLGTPSQLKRYCAREAESQQGRPLRIRFDLGESLHRANNVDTLRLLELGRMCQFLRKLGQVILIRVYSSDPVNVASAAEHATAHARAQEALLRLGVAADEIVTTDTPVDVTVDEAAVLRGCLEKELGFYYPR